MMDFAHLHSHTTHSQSLKTFHAYSVKLSIRNGAEGWVDVLTDPNLTKHDYADCITPLCTG